MSMDPIQSSTNSALNARFASGNAGSVSRHGHHSGLAMAKFAVEHAPAFAASAAMDGIAHTARGTATAATSLAANPAFASLVLPPAPGLRNLARAAGITSKLFAALKALV